MDAYQREDLIHAGALDVPLNADDVLVVCVDDDPGAVELEELAGPPPEPLQGLPVDVHPPRKPVVPPQNVMSTPA